MAMQFIRADVAHAARKSAFPVSLLFRTDAGGNFRRCVVPGDDLSALPQGVRDAINSHWATLGGQAAWDALNAPPPPTAGDVRSEGLRRAALAIGAAGYEDRGDAALAFIVAQAANDTATLSELQTLYQALKAIKAAAKTLIAMSPIPADYAADGNWPA